MSSSISALTAGGGGVVTSADASGNLNLQSGTTTILALTSTGVAITGTLSATGVTTGAAGSAALPAITTTGDTDTGVWFPAANTLAASTAGVEALRIDSSGNLLVGTTSTTNGAKLSVNGVVYMNNTVYVPGVYSLTTGSAANVHIASDGTLYRSTSSLKYKTDVQEATHGLADALKLRAVTYKGKNDGETIFGGLIAEEVHEAGLTEFVQYAEDGSPDALSYGNMVSLAFKAIQEQQALITQLQTQITALNAKVGI